MPKSNSRNTRGKGRDNTKHGSYRPNSRSKQRDKEDESEEVVPNRGNETDKVQKSKGKRDYNKLAFYIRDKQILEQASALSFQSFIGGTPIDNYQIPSIMRIFMNPSPGLTYKGATPALNHPIRSGINMAGIKLFNKLSMSSGRNMQYAPQDVSTMILAMSQVLAMHSYVHRLFQSVTLWNNFNRMVPRALIESMGIDYDDFVENFSDYRTRYNAIVTSFNQLPIIVNIGYLEKCMTQFSYIFTDDDSPLAQMYLYLPESTWIIDETSYQGGTILKTTPVVPATGTRTFGNFLLNVFRPMIDALVTSSTLNLVYADLLNYASKNSDLKFTVLDYVVEGESIMPVKSWEALLHIHNMTIMDAPDLPTFTSGQYTPNNDVYPDPSNNMLLYNPGRSHGLISTGKVPTTVIFDSPVAAPDAETRIEMSRYVGVHTENQITVSNVKYDVFTVVPDYYVTRVLIIADDVSNQVQLRSWVDDTTVNATWPFRTDIMASQFDWRPITRTFDPSTGKYTGIDGDLNFWTTVDVYYLERLNEVIYLGLFDIQ